MSAAIGQLLSPLFRPSSENFPPLFNPQPLNPVRMVSFGLSGYKLFHKPALDF